MSSSDQNVDTADRDDGSLVRLICYAGAVALPLLVLFVHLLLIYRS